MEWNGMKQASWNFRVFELCLCVFGCWHWWWCFGELGVCVCVRESDELWWRGREAMELWKSWECEFPKSEFDCSRHWGSLPLSVSCKGCCNCKIDYKLFWVLLNSFALICFALLCLDSLLWTEEVMLLNKEKQSIVYELICWMIFHCLFFMEQVNRMLKPDKWQALSDSEGKVLGFRKALKLIVLGVCCHFCSALLCFFFLLLFVYSIASSSSFSLAVIIFKFWMLGAHEFSAHCLV